VAPFYGCQLLRPSKLMGFDDPDRPTSLETVIEACGGEPVDYPAKTLCCGFPILLAREKTSLAELARPLEQALAAGAEAMVTSCPLCHLSLDAWQKNAERSLGRKIGLPVFHLSQLVALAAGLAPAELQFSRHVVPLDSVLTKLTSPLAEDG
jgi:succinate dehydrogenase / fumarate reductase, cytochrome b subunit